MYVCMYVYVYMYVCIYVCMYVYVCMYICMYVYVYFFYFIACSITTVILHASYYSIIQFSYMYRIYPKLSNGIELTKLLNDL
jgi:hypothetical protein